MSYSRFGMRLSGLKFEIERLQGMVWSTVRPEGTVEHLSDPAQALERLDGLQRSILSLRDEVARYQQERQSAPPKRWDPCDQ